MKLHGTAAVSLNGRRRLVELVIEQGRSIAPAADAAGVSERTCSKWVARYRADGQLALFDRSSALSRCRNRTDQQLVGLLAALRQLRSTTPDLADPLDIPVSTISGILKRIGLGSSVGSVSSPQSATSAPDRASWPISISTSSAGSVQAPGSGSPALHTSRPSTRSRAARQGSDTSAPAPTDPDQRQTRTIHPNPPQRLGVRRDLSLKRRTHRRP
jgi:transposase